VQTSVFKVFLNLSVTGDLSPDGVKAFQCDLADWCPGPVLLKPGTKVRYRGKSWKDWQHVETGKVVEHLATDPRIFFVRLTGESEDIKLFYSSLIWHGMGVEPNKKMKQIVDSLLSSAKRGSHFTVIGYSEFMCTGRLHCEYWISLNAGNLPLKFNAGQLPSNPSLCVVHVEFACNFAKPAEVLRASLRPTQAVVLGSYRDKCSSCRQCLLRRDCPLSNVQ